MYEYVYMYICMYLCFYISMNSFQSSDCYITKLGMGTRGWVIGRYIVDYLYIQELTPEF